jgi:hypothetical protein
MPYENIIALVLVVLVLLVPLLKWAKYKWMIELGDLYFSDDDLSNPAKLEAKLGGAEKFAQFFHKNQYDFGRKLGRRAAAFEARCREIVAEKLDEIWKCLDAMVAGKAGAKETFEKLFAEWSGLLSTSQVAAIDAQLETIKEQERKPQSR